ncbi:signal peptidase I [Celeribacter ethanolicus]|uniref:Signal peptidase I n=1 Tax=Celeribacter ethanolicus TaxID=1758178 RepID=A0A291GF92_9RHOB|nr:signal peptidase I [Celeribacter ethanolicus]ATG48722.1 S26 family signal peptidase [Celeribacter ethanolicus]TNE68036.1 MAG: signal peptidase I [Paracoccaceae bacterium]
MSSAKDSLTETVKTVVYALLIAGIFRTFFFQPFFIPSSSMKDTLLIGDFLFVNKMSYGYSQWSCPKIVNFLCPISGRILGSEPERGDIVVFEHPTEHRTFVKRLIGLPGDQVQLRDGVIFLNGEEVPQTPDGVFVETYERQGAAGHFPACANTPGEGGDCIKEKYIETLPGGRQHSVLNIRDISLDNTAVYTVPAGNYFFMGDNRDNSADSRLAPSARGVGFVPEEYLLGKVNRVMFSAAGKRLVYFWTWRKDRFFKALQ